MRLVHEETLLEELEFARRAASHITDLETRLEERAAELHATDRARLEALAEVERLTAALGEARDALRRTNARPYLLTAQAWSTEDGAYTIAALAAK